jgi:hypothetical protein
VIVTARDRGCMTTARKRLLDAHPDAAYHCFSRCVRRAHLCGFDAFTGRSFEHRRGWIEDRLQLLSRAFAVSIYAYAILSNHFHVVLRMRSDVAANWGPLEVARRWLLVFPGRVSRAADSENEVERLAQDSERVARMRERLCSLSWLMRSLKEPIARRANREDDCKGHFWEGRFHNQILLEPRSLVGAMVYTDLNPLRAGLTDSIASAPFTSGRQRYVATSRRPAMLASALEPAAGIASPGYVALTEGEYLSLLEWSGRFARAGPSDTAARAISSLMSRLSCDTREWRDYAFGLQQRWSRAVGSRAALAALAARLGQRWLKGGGAASI